jgi:hypothetical protein
MILIHCALTFLRTPFWSPERRLASSTDFILNYDFPNIAIETEPLTPYPLAPPLANPFSFSIAGPGGHGPRSIRPSWTTRIRRMTVGYFAVQPVSRRT